MKRLVLLISGLLILLGGSYWFYTAHLALDEKVNSSAVETNNVESSQEELSTESIALNSTQGQEETETQSVEEETTKEQMADLPEQPPTPNIEMMTIEGETVYLKDLLADGKPAILNIWASWCPPCKEEMPIFEEYSEQYKDNIHFIMLNATQSRPTETVDAALTYLETEGLNLPIYFDIDFNGQIAFGARTLPTTIVIDNKGDVLVYYPGQVTSNTMDQFINYIIN